ncbi:MAG TPA: PqqD family protein [Thermoleophilaceae bacterium]|nr:PqqD family protein [Thermoleophilaceae bacterium]
MPIDGHFRIDPRKVVHETIDGETIVIHLETGTYYSLAGCGPEIWELLADGKSAGEVVRQLEATYSAEPGVIEETTGELLREMCAEELLERVSGNGAHSAAPGEPAAGATGYEPPRLQKYTDMQYFLLLDPVHEVEEAGWPYTKDEAQAAERPSPG